jgi:hypothetical protein
MRLDPNPARTKETCKIKRVNPAFRSVSTPRRMKDLPQLGPVNPTTRQRPTDPPNSTFDWSPERLGERLRIELAPEAWKRLVRAAQGARCERQTAPSRGPFEVA